MKEIKKLSKNAHKYLIDQKPQTWNRAFFDTKSACDAVENNMSECFNGCIVKARQKPVIAMVDDIRMATMVRLQKKKGIVGNWQDFLCPNVTKK